MNFEKKYDLHCHSTCSDGSLSPTELIDLAKRKKLDGICITDHDTVSAYTDQTREYALSSGIELISGIEISTNFKGQTIHVLAYGIDQGIEPLIDRIYTERLKRNQRILEYLRLSGIELSMDEVHKYSSTSSVGRPHIANALVQKKIVKNFREAFDKYLRDDKILPVQRWELETKDCVKEIQKNGAIAILAHPHLLHSKKKLNQLLALGFDGLECYYANFRYDNIQYYLQIAKSENLLITGGSDFHGGFNPNIDLGASYTNLDDKQKLAKGYSCKAI